MAEAIIFPIAKSILKQLASFTGNHVTDELKAAKSAKKDLKIIAEDLTAICAVLQDAEAKQYANESMKIWLRDLKSVVYDIDDLLDEVATDALQKRVVKGHFLPQVRYYLSVASNPLVSRFRLSHKIKELHDRLESIVAKKNKYELTQRPVEEASVERDLFNDCAYINKAGVVGRDNARKEIMRRLLCVGDNAGCPCVIPIVGLGGIGKTTLTKLVYEDLSDEFDMKLWGCVSDKFDKTKLIEEIIRGASGEDTSNKTTGQLVKKLQKLLDGKKFFLVLDDVWLDDIATWAELKSVLEVGRVGSVVLLTTRSAQVAEVTRTVEPYNLDRLSDDVCLSMFRQLAFMEGEERKYPVLYEIGKSIVEKCGGVPLVVKNIGSLLRRVRDEREWKRINDMDTLTKLPGEYSSVLKLLRISYDKLPSHLKPCFAYCSLIAKDTELYPTLLVYMWNALGLLEVRDDDIEGRGHAYAMELVSRSLLEQPDLHIDDTIYSCKIHDLLHDLAVDVLGEELAVITQNELNVSELTRHIVWGYEGPDGLKGVDFPKQLLVARKARAFRFGNRMNHVSHSFLQGIISNFTCLRVLEISDSKFEELPKSIGYLKHLRGLKLAYNPLLKSLPETVCKLVNLQSLDLYYCEKLVALPKKIYKLLKLRYFVVTTCQKSLSGTKFFRLCSLRFLWFCSCRELESVWDEDNIGLLASLRRLYIQNCPKLISLPNSIKGLTALEDLVISDCQQLNLEKNECLSGLRSLRSLAIIDVPQLTRLPDGIQSAADSLQYLSIANCGRMTQLGDWLQCFSYLRKFSILYCPNLLTLPGGFRHLELLQELTICDCPHLSRRCAVPDGEDYHLICHVPAFCLDGRYFTPQQGKAAL